MRPWASAVTATRCSRVVNALVAANRANLALDWKKGCAIDLAGRDVVEAIHTSVHPKVIDCPGDTSIKKSIDAVAKDGIQVKARARVTVRTNIQQLIGGATEETVIARVGERRKSSGVTRVSRSMPAFSKARSMSRSKFVVTIARQTPRRASSAMAS